MKKVIYILVIVVPMLFIPSLIINADKISISSPGSVDDPVITRSYLEKNIQEIILNELKKNNNTSREIGESTTVPHENEQQQTVNNNLTIIKLEPGQSLYGGSGTELIVRTGKTVVFSNDESGIADVTIGKDIIAGQAVELNHMLIVPREGRGIKPDPKNNQEIYVMVRGSYLLTNADGSKVSP